ncbi:MAG: cache domain-containing protein, partial [Gammaproteobacteria bacterium]|nr:cache domain-containing protein [Gammaproteobacteria bacterium]
MPIGIPNLSFRSKVVMLAVALVAAIQLITLFSVLNALKNEQLRQADASVTLAGVVYDEYMRNRTEQLSTTVSVLVQDFPFREAIGLRDVRNIEDVLENHSRRAGADAAAVFDLNGEHIASSGGGRSLRAAALAAMARYDETGQIGEPTTTTAFVDDKLHQAVTVPVVAPTVIAWVTMAFPVDAALAADIRKLTGLESSFVSFDVGRTEIHATTLPLEQRDAAFAGVLLGADRDSAGALGGTDWITRLAPIRSNDGASRAEDRGVYVALQLPMMAALRAYRDIRNNLIAVAAIAVVLTISAAVWLSRMVTRPIASLVEAARRLGEGIYTHKIEVKSTDEFAVLAAGFNSMQQAIANREQDIVHMAHHDSLSGLPTREIVVSEMRDAIAATDQLAVVNFVLHRFDELASSLGHRTADKLIQLVAGRLRDQLEDGHLLGHLKHQEFVLVLPDAD